MEEPKYPFCVADFFDRFQVGETILHLRFLKKITEKATPIDKKEDGESYLVECDAIGINQGRDVADAIRLRITGERTDLIPAANIRRLKELGDDEMHEILSELSRALLQLKVIGGTGLPEVITLINKLRAINDQHDILVPRARMA